MHNLRKTLEAPTKRISELPVDDRGYPVPWFVAEVNGKYDFRVADPRKWERAVKENLCWVCGQKMGAFKTFVIGPMCGINRTTAEPPCHLECGEWSARNCPFLSNPKMVRDEENLVGENPAGHMIKRNPGVVLVWTTKSYSIFDDGNGRPLIEIGTPLTIIWYAEGKHATRKQVSESVTSGYPILLDMAKAESPEAARKLMVATNKLVELFPKDEMIDGVSVIAGDTVDMAKLPYDQQVAILGKPMADVLQEKPETENGVYSVQNGVATRTE